MSRAPSLESALEINAMGAKTVLDSAARYGSVVRFAYLLLACGCWTDSSKPLPKPTPVARDVIAAVPEHCHAAKPALDARSGPLAAEEIEQMAANQNAANWCCWRKTRHAERTKVMVTFMVAEDGRVEQVELSEVEPPLRNCLTGLIGEWRFRASPGGMFRFAMAFGED